jgi:uncharacterized membrane protein
MIQDESTSSFGLQPNVAAGLAALFSWVGGLVILLGKPAQAWVRFIAVQSIVLGAVMTVIWIAFRIVIAVLFSSGLWPLAGVVGLIWLLVLLVYFVALIATTIRAFQGVALRLPIFAPIADRYVPASTKL